MAPNIVAIIFDFDETLAPDSTSSLIESLALDVPHFWQKTHRKLLDDGWDSVAGYLYLLLEESKKRPQPITRELLAKTGKSLELYNGATRIFDRLRKYVEASAANARLEFYLVSSGIGEILRNTKIARHFTDIWACDFHYDSRGAIVFPRNIISFTDKTRYLFQIAKGIVGKRVRSLPFEVNRKLGEDELRVPWQHMIMVGDGYTDIPCFSLVRKNGGVAIGVYDSHSRERWGRAWGFIEEGRVSNLVPADYRKNSALENSLIMALDSILSRLKLREVTYTPSQETTRSSSRRR
jgi:phosphoserine phosphatase